MSLVRYIRKILSGQDYYKSVRGDPATNGLGHKVIVDEGVQKVVVPGAPIWKVQKKRAKITDIVTELDSSSRVLVEGQLQQKQAEICGSVFGFDATGKHAGLLAKEQPQAALPAANSDKAIWGHCHCQCQASCGLQRYTIRARVGRAK